MSPSSQQQTQDRCVARCSAHRSARHPGGLGKQQGHSDTGSSLLSRHLPGTQSGLNQHSLKDAKHWDPFLRFIISRTGQQSRVRAGDTFHK